MVLAKNLRLWNYQGWWIETVVAVAGREGRTASPAQTWWAQLLLLSPVDGPSLARRNPASQALSHTASTAWLCSSTLRLIRPPTSELSTTTHPTNHTASVKPCGWMKPCPTSMKFVSSHSSTEIVWFFRNLLKNYSLGKDPGSWEITFSKGKQAMNGGFSIQAGWYTKGKCFITLLYNVCWW